mmetsp:Transcript_41619/g.109648  ORF Transcript_41619/g.109648 Transcript_41619/m.109648 type:complete len:201 (+) Transcript_41619:830-1432(+)
MLVSLRLLPRHGLLLRALHPGPPRLAQALHPVAHDRTPPMPAIRRVTQPLALADPPLVPQGAGAVESRLLPGGDVPRGAVPPVQTGLVRTHVHPLLAPVPVKPEHTLAVEPRDPVLAGALVQARLLVAVVDVLPAQPPAVPGVAGAGEVVAVAGANPVVAAGVLEAPIGDHLAPIPRRPGLAPALVPVVQVHTDPAVLAR